LIKTLKNILLTPEESSSKEEALEEFKQNYLETKEFIRLTIYWMIRSDEVDDLVQATFVKAWQHYKGFKRNSSFKTWIYRIAMNTTYDYINKKNKIKIDNNVTEFESHSQDNELRDLISQALLTLNLKQREAFILYYKLGYKTHEIASLLKTAEGTIKSRLHHAKVKFTYFMNENGVSDE
jgi:RNA polymerase sigma-70 factor (ECF subfamily)